MGRGGVKNEATESFSLAEEEKKKKRGKRNGKGWAGAAGDACRVRRPVRELFASPEHYCVLYRRD